MEISKKEKNYQNNSRRSEKKLSEQGIKFRVIMWINRILSGG